MRLDAAPLSTVDWESVPPDEHPGERGLARWRTRQFGDVRVRMVEYSPGYVADHWCSKGHVVLCVRGEVSTELQDGRRQVLRQGMTYVVGDGGVSHRSSTAGGATLFIVD